MKFCFISFIEWAVCNVVQYRAMKAASLNRGQGRWCDKISGNCNISQLLSSSSNYQNQIWSEHQISTSRWIRCHGRRCGTASWRWTWGTWEFHIWTCVYVILEQTYFCLWTCVDVVIEQTYFLRWVSVWHQQLVSDNMELWRRDLALEEELKQKRPILGY